MNSITSDSEAILRLVVFIAVFSAMAVLEMLLPRRQLTVSKSRRWLSNLGLSALNTILLRVFIPIAGVAAAYWAEDRNWGLLKLVEFADWIGILIFLLVFDLLIYFQHRLFHKVPFLWRLHRTHHTDLDYDVTTGSRFHPLSILISAFIKLALILILGPLAIAVVLAEVLLNATAMFNHSNIKIPVRLVKLLRNFVVTPDMHRIHHSVDAVEHNRNFGFNFPWWDRLFGTYLAEPKLGQEAMGIGINGFEDDSSISLQHLLTQPFKDPS